MGNPLRNRDASIFRVITIRTVRGEMWLAPTGKNTRLIGGIIARYQEILGIEIYAYIVLSNHIHLLIRAPQANADEFAENVNREIARRINWKYQREGSLWSRRYSEQEVLDEDTDLLEAFVYITLNATRHGLLKDASKWKGLHSYNHAITETDRVFTFTHYSDLDEQGVPKKTTHRLTLTPLPHFSGLSKKARSKKVRELLQSRMEQFWEARGDKPYLEQAQIDDQVPGATPLSMSRSPRPSCYSKCAERIREWMQERRLLLSRYAEASLRYRLGQVDISFPLFTFKPPLHRAPRIVRFTPLTADYLKICA